MTLQAFLNLGMLDPKESARAKAVNKFFDLIMLFVMFWLPLQWYSQTKGELSLAFIHTSDWMVWSLFVIETIVMLFFVQRKFFYLLSNWLNVVIIIAAFPPLWTHSSAYVALLRYLRFIILLRLILPQLRHVFRILSRNHFGTTLLIFLLVTLLSGILITYIDPEIGSLENGIWWAWQTVTTVGYGDVLPNTLTGKMFASLLMLIGVGLFSLVSANLAAYFIERGHRQKAKKPEQQQQKNFRFISERLDRLEENNRQILSTLNELLNKEKE